MDIADTDPQSYHMDIIQINVNNSKVGQPVQPAGTSVQITVNIIVNILLRTPHYH